MSPMPAGSANRAGSSPSAHRARMEKPATRHACSRVRTGPAVQRHPALRGPGHVARGHPDEHARRPAAEVGGRRRRRQGALPGAAAAIRLPAHRPGDGCRLRCWTRWRRGVSRTYPGRGASGDGRAPFRPTPTEPSVAPRIMRGRFAGRPGPAPSARGATEGGLTSMIEDPLPQKRAKRPRRSATHRLRC
jgi:hypothetical protein